MKSVTEITTTSEPLQSDDERRCHSCTVPATHAICASDVYGARLSCCDKEDCKKETDFVVRMLAIGPPEPTEDF